MVLAQKQIWNQDMNPQSYAQIIFDQGTKNIPWKKEIHFNKCCWKK
jgi:hypothetical protein